MKVFIRLGSHPIYEDLIRYPPAGVEYVYSASKNRYSKLRFLWKYYSGFRPPAIYVNSTDSDIIHSNAGIMILNKKPWVMDIEDIGSLVNFNYGKLNSNRYLKSIISIINSRWCKKIMPYTFAAKRSIESKLPQVKGKLEVVYPAIHSTSFKKEKHEKVRLLFISTRFYEKGGPQILEAFRKLDNRYDMQLTMITNTPDEFKVKYNSKNIEFLEPTLTRDELLREYYPSSDILLFLSHFDTFGFVMLEAMNFSLPIIGLRQYSTPEVVENGKNGFLLDCRYVRDNFPQYETIRERMNFLKDKPQKDVVRSLIEKCSLLIENDKLRKRMGRSGKEMVAKGRFSINYRNRKLKDIYEEAI
ncbi:MAG: hypothetical protein A2Y66_00845 [Nitrospirae bacterium RBG_13_41_22]|nr:MAG: hypothetical protein A2Y66_00845 [Nitrospirae bacterium RBG_13_41_22]